MKKLRISSHALCIFVHASEVWKNARILCLLNFSDPRKNLLARCWDIKRVNGGQPAADEVLYPGFQSYRLGLFLCTNLPCFYYNSSSPSTTVPGVTTTTTIPGTTTTVPTTTTTAPTTTTTIAATYTSCQTWKILMLLAVSLL